MNMKNLKILIVDDAPFIRDGLRRILTKAGYQVVGEADDGEKAVQMAWETKPDLVIMDIVMPLKSGVQATKEILMKNPKVKIIACSTVDQATMLMRIMEAGAKEFINKPFNADDVVCIIEKVTAET